jgi:DNA mismatch endonuclease, patch repair protein
MTASADKFDTQQRSAVMRAVKSHDTTPERAVRKLLSARGYRYRLQRKDLPGHPDIAFPGRRAAIFVHGCFWHGHDCKRGARMPKANAAYWRGKIERNAARDVKTKTALETLGWRSLIVWECEIKSDAALEQRLIDFLR